MTALHENSRENDPRVYSPEKHGSIEHEGTLDVIRALRTHAENQKRGIDDDICVYLYICPGTMQGVYGAGLAIALHKAGLTHGLRLVVGVSTGAPIAAYLITGQSEVGATLYPRFCTTKNFSNPRRLPDGNMLDMGYLSRLYRGDVEDVAMDKSALEKSPLEFLIGVTDYETGECVLMDGKVDTINKLEASCAIPILYSKPEVIIDGRRYVDGFVSESLPLEKTLEKQRPSHVLVFANCAKDHPASLPERLTERMLAAPFPKPLHEALLSTSERFDKNIDSLRESGIPYLIIWTDKAVGPMTMDARMLADASKRSEAYFTELIAQI